MNYKKNIVITGASKGIGYQLVKRYIENANIVVAISRNKTLLDELANSCKEKFPDSQLHTICFDLSDSEIEKKLIPKILSKIDKIDILINNAGILANYNFKSFSHKKLKEVFEVNFFSVFILIQKLFYSFADDAHIINISSVGGITGSSKYKGLSVYSSSKSALNCLTECLAEEYKDLNLTFNSLALGSVQTEMFSKAFPGQKAQVTPKQISKFIFDFSFSAKQTINGKVINVSRFNP